MGHEMALTDKEVHTHTPVRTTHMFHSKMIMQLWTHTQGMQRESQRVRGVRERQRDTLYMHPLSGNLSHRCTVIANTPPTLPRMYALHAHTQTHTYSAVNQIRDHTKAAIRNIH